MNGLKTKEEALELIYGRWTPHTETETVSIDECLGRVAAEDIYAQFNIPVVRSSAMDGIAVKSEMFFDETTGQEKFPDTENWVIGRDYVRADTGDDFDDAYDAVIAIEMAEILENGGVKLDLSEPKGPGAKDRKGPFKVRKGVNVRPAGSSVKQGELLISKGTYIRPEDIAAIAMGGSAEVRVMKKPVVAFIPTGSELVSAGTPLKRGQNYNSNAPMVKAMLTQMGAEPVIMPIVKDNKSELKASLEEAVKIADIVVISGGSSKGEEDFNTRLLDETGELLLHGVAAVPGRPTGIAIIDGKPVINTSGPAVACFYGMKWCIGSLVASCLETGSKPGYRRAVMLAEDLHTPPVMSVLVRLNVVETENGPVAQQLTGSRPGLIATMHTNAVFMSEIGKSLYPAGSVIEVEMRV